MVIYAEGGNCFKAVPVRENCSEFENLRRIMEDQGVKMTVLDSPKNQHRFCLEYP